jgi:hypothetical protein
MNSTHVHLHPLLKAVLPHLKNDTASRAPTSSTGFKEVYT